MREDPRCLTIRCIINFAFLGLTKNKSILLFFFSLQLNVNNILDTYDMIKILLSLLVISFCYVWEEILYTCCEN